MGSGLGVRGPTRKHTFGQDVPDLSASSFNVTGGITYWNYEHCGQPHFTFTLYEWSRSETFASSSPTLIISDVD